MKQFFLFILVFLCFENHALAQIQWKTNNWPNGKIKDKEPISNGLKQGTAEYRWDNGQLYGFINWVEGSKDGKVILYRKDGTLDQIQNFQRGVRHGLFQWYDTKGNLTLEETYANGTLAQANPVNPTPSQVQNVSNKRTEWSEIFEDAFIHGKIEAIVFMLVIFVITAFFILTEWMRHKRQKLIDEAAPHVLKSDALPYTMPISEIGPRHVTVEENDIFKRILLIFMPLSIISLSVIYLALEQSDKTMRDLLLISSIGSSIGLIFILNLLLKKIAKDEMELLKNGIAKKAILKSIYKGSASVLFQNGAVIEEKTILIHTLKNIGNLYKKIGSPVTLVVDRNNKKGMIYEGSRYKAS